MTLTASILKLDSEGRAIKEIADLLDSSPDYVRKVRQRHGRATPRQVIARSRLEQRIKTLRAQLAEAEMRLEKMT